ncbi:hypothetical protein AciX9_1496 [Granulicella tundricola MP5ACTX9]|uniref:Uncharacterized protein n=2 Tax=Granulicella TaxID=940557 RepID=E8WWY8_GRATM|nr:hypothetical protein AciX9_1496 [Granulicella tundricola MP5ACTX9]
MASSRKKVLVRMLDQTIHAGYLPLMGIVSGMETGLPVIELLDLSGRLETLALDEVRHVAYVRDFNLDNAVDPENLVRRTFLARPRTEGLWVRIQFAGGDVLEGLAALDIGLADGLLEDRGVYLIPPDIRSNTQRLFVPRAAMTQLQVLGVVTTPSKPARVVKVAAESIQDDLFPALSSDSEG